MNLLCRLTTYVIISLLVVVLMGGCVSKGGSPGAIKVLCLASLDTKIQGLVDIDPKVVEAYRGMGYELVFDYYQNVDRATLSKYPVVIGMIPQLHAGTKAIDDKLGQAIEDYVKDGGGFLLMPSPSYYGGRDFIVQLNPWLAKFGARLINDIPSDPTHQKTIPRILAYRYIETSNIVKDPITDGVGSVWLPIDFSDDYVMTHTMEVSSDWRVLVRGERSCATRPFREPGDKKDVIGAYDSEPPFLAVRSLGKGSMAIFSTDSSVFIYDACHWANGSGFVLENGGLRLMANLLGSLSANWTPPAAVAVDSAKSPEVQVVGNVQVCQDKGAWLETVTRERMPKGFGVKYYVDCGAMSDLPYSVARGFGRVDAPGSNWLIRWPWSEIFHATGSNSRAFDVKELTYRFDGLDPVKPLKLGLMVWGFQDEGARSLMVKAGPKDELRSVIELPRFKAAQGPAFHVLDVPAACVADGVFAPVFAVGEGGMGTFSSVCELWLFEAGTSSLTPEEIMARFESPSAVRDSLLSDWKHYPGLIGARSSLTDGRNTVAEMSDAARKAGLSYLVFTDDALALDQEKLDRLKAECLKVSDKDFLAIPGFSFSSSYAGGKRTADNPRSWGAVDAFVFQNVDKLPTQADLRDPHSLYWKFFGGEYCGGHRMEPTLIHPGKNGIPPFFQRFWRGFDVMTFDAAGKIDDDSRKCYADLLASGYGPFPRVSGELKSVDDVAKAAAGWRTVIASRTLGEMPLFHYTSLVTNGPRIVRYAFSFDHMREIESGGGLLSRGACWVTAHIKVESEKTITGVTLMSGDSVARRWCPGTVSFEVDEPLLVSGRSELWMKVEAAGGGEAITGRVLTQDFRYFIGMCADNQNTICCLSKPPSKFVKDDRELYLQHSYWHTGEAAGQLGMLKDAQNLVPRVFETGIIQPVKHFKPCPRLTFADGSVEDHVNSELRIKSGSVDCNVVEYRFEHPGCRASSVTTLTSFRPSVGGGTAMLVECELNAKEDMELGAGEDAFTILSLGLMPPLSPTWKYSCTPVGGGIKNGIFSAIAAGTAVTANLDPAGGVMLWPCEAGNLLVFPLDANAYDVRMDNVAKKWNLRERLELYPKYKSLKKGERVLFKNLVVLHADSISSPEELGSLRKLYVGGSGISKVLCGTLDGKSSYPAAFEAKDGTVSAVFDVQAKANPMPVVARGLNPRWSAARVDETGVTVIGADSAPLMTVVDPAAAAHQIQIGNLLKSSDKELGAEWGGRHAGGVRALLHNPTDRRIDSVVSTNAALRGVPAMSGEASLSPGESVWVWGSGKLLVREGASTQVESAKSENGVMTLTIRGSGQFIFSGPWENAIVNGSEVAAKAVNGWKVIELGGKPVNTLVLGK